MNALISLVVCGIVVPIIAFAISSANKARAQRAATLAELARALDGVVDEAGAHGRCNDVEVTFRFATRGSGKNAQPWTEIDSAIPHAYPLAIHVRRHGVFDRGKIARGDMVDIEVGDPAFDDAFLVEAAPAEIARDLIDAGMRSALLSADPSVELTTETKSEISGMHKHLRLAFRSWQTDGNVGLHLIRTVTHLASRVREAFDKDDRAVPVHDVGSPFRPQLDPNAVADHAAARAAEVDKLDTMLVQRARSQKIVGVVVTVLLVGVVTAIAIAAPHHHR